MVIDKIVCVGKNYLDHAKELGDAVPEKPVLFLKPPSVLLQAQNWGQCLQAKFPAGFTEVQPECELVLKIENQNISAVTIGLEMTLRTLQSQLKKNGLPWTTAKVFPDAAIIGPWIPISHCQDFLDTPFSLELDGKLCQQSQGNRMMTRPDKLLTYIESFFPLCDGDLVFTGTPAGVTAIYPDSKATVKFGGLQFQVHW
ncbi:MAG: Isomerase [Gammaproteobacteria bacterium]|jgi:2-keto-4-pentenoate hydratase/2-oxohepta-3-ene-1,7-dioic acid hydratase in catechol pathway|nr:Isomerase [Gammaproteobacteria bacterium]